MDKRVYMRILDEIRDENTRVHNKNLRLEKKVHILEKRLNNRPIDKEMMILK